jgi:hypothetical protein
MQKNTLLWLGRKLSLCLLMLAAVVVTTSSAHGNGIYVARVPETSGGSAELIAVLGIVAAALVLRRKTAKN